MHRFTAKQFIKSDVGSVWSFVSSPKNLAVITPPHMGFDIIDEDDLVTEMYAGQIIEYYVSPILKIKLHWVTEITHVEKYKYFVDEQRMGPYSFWHHRHFLKEVNGGVEMTDIVNYKVPLGIMGRIVNGLLIKNQLKSIFDYRYKKIDEIFNQKN
jgi:ligand-binding SRPBCC domain-containing protein